ncbi:MULTISPECIES: hypothetical protein [unclassified Streptomyces]|uniref:tRNA adenosine deaminase-associated protein n=1 Tax=unclassified Streptomyces TaxID=2593676 RepID=UPI00081D9B7B|nr:MULTISPECIES: hypothetical protein [unclassified Streptomyces]MYR30590.1 hypothetical protein [Streptomyces sp. SID4945]SCD74552.1 putative tRNA adenosine deaminase-associated protein [Streptomyces sp. TverLS-915]SCF50191.1 putative tRNA adenosine deaminase-associated protein [Streptomyces sp. LcepLS]
MYFTALLARTEDGWEASDTELDDVETLSDLTDLAREYAERTGAEDDTVLVYVEQEEGAWFGLVRVDGEDDPRVYVSAAQAAARSSYGEILLTDELLGREPTDVDPSTDLDALDLDGTEEGDPDQEEDADREDYASASADSVPPGPVGDAEILADLGMAPADLLTVDESDPLAAIGEALGIGELADAVR